MVVRAEAVIDHIGIITSRKFIVDKERAGAYYGYVLCGVHDIRCASYTVTSQAHNRKNHLEGGSSKNSQELAVQELLCCVLLGNLSRIKYLIASTEISGKENWKLFLSVRGEKRLQVLYLRNRNLRLQILRPSEKDPSGIHGENFCGRTIHTIWWYRF